MRRILHIDMSTREVRGRLLGVRMGKLARRGTS
jgi:hypothetical protein